MPEKKIFTTFGIVSTHIISTSFLLPIIWLIVGLFSKMILVQMGINEVTLTIVYYLLMLGFFYLGIRHSLNYLQNNVVILQPDKSCRYSIIVFCLGLLSSNYGLYFFEKMINYPRIVFSFLLMYMFSTMTQKYFDKLISVEEYCEYGFVFQIIILCTNISLLIMLLMFYGILSMKLPWANSILIFIFVLLFNASSKQQSKIFIPFFRQAKESIPYRRIGFTFCITMTTNILLTIFVMKYF